MRRALFTFGLLACLLAVVTASTWSPIDQEIFRLRDEVELSEGPDVTFYDFLGIQQSASQDDINAAFKKRSRTLHPDKVKQQFIADKSTGNDKKKGKKPGVHVDKGPTKAEINAAAKKASDRYARLGVVANLLRGEGRARYDHFLSNGFPKWKGTGYYYSRFRPGLASVLTGLFIFVGGAGHWLALYMSWKRQTEFVERYISYARRRAWGDGLAVPGLDLDRDSRSGTATPPVTGDDSESAQPVNRKQRRMQEAMMKKDKGEKKEKKVKKAVKASPVSTPVTSTGPRKRVQAENGKMLIVDIAGNVYLEQADEDGQIQEFLLDPKEMSAPTIKDTALVRVPVWTFHRLTGRLLSKPNTSDEAESYHEELEDVVPSSSSGAEDFEVLEGVKTSSQNGNGKVIKRKKSGRK